MTTKQQRDPDAVYIKSELNKGDVADSQAAAYYRKSLEHYRSAGKRLAKVRDECKQKEHPYYRKWLEWLEENGIDQQRVSECTRLHEGWDKLPLGGSFGLKEALRIIKGTGEVAHKSGQQQSKATDELADGAPSTSSPVAKSGTSGPSRSPARKDKLVVDDGSRDVPPLGLLPKELADEMDVVIARIKRAHGLTDNPSAVHEGLRAYGKLLTAQEVGEVTP